MPTGIKKFFNVHKGYGFVTPNDGDQKPVFFPKEQLTAASLPNLNAGDHIEYELESDGRNTRAVHLKLLPPL